jgi:hypothetical protein
MTVRATDQFPLFPFKICISFTHGTLRMGIYYCIVTIDDSMPWSPPSPYAPISVRLSFHRPELISRHKRCLQRFTFWWSSRKPFCEIRGWHQFLDACSFTRFTSEIRTSAISAVCGQNADHFSVVMLCLQFPWTFLGFTLAARLIHTHSKNRQSLVVAPFWWRGLRVNGHRSRAIWSFAK